MKVIIKTLVIDKIKWSNEHLMRVILRVLGETDPFKSVRVPKVVKRSFCYLYGLADGTFPNTMYTADELYKILEPFDKVYFLTRSEILDAAEPFLLHKAFYFWDFQSAITPRADFLFLFEELLKAEIKGIKLKVDLSLAVNYLLPTVEQQVRNYESKN